MAEDICRCQERHCGYEIEIGQGVLFSLLAYREEVESQSMLESVRKDVFLLVLYMDCSVWLLPSGAASRIVKRAPGRARTTVVMSAL